MRNILKTSSTGPIAIDRGKEIRNYLTIDIEDYYQVSAFENVIATSEWDSIESRVEDNTLTLLDILDEHQVKATCFIVGWIAKRHPHLVEEIDRRGHDIGCHSYLHRKIYDLTPKQFKEDTLKAKSILEDIINRRVVSYRAPSYSVTRESLWALDILNELGFKNDSSIFPIAHDIYGIPDSPRFKHKLQGDALTEYPISTAKLLGLNIPVAGGGYFRLFPYWLTKKLLRKINRLEKQPFMFYLHPWEIDPQQPRVKNAKMLSKFRHYNNLHKTLQRLRCLLNDFKFRPIQYTDSLCNTFAASMSKSDRDKHRL